MVSRAEFLRRTKIFSNGEIMDGVKRVGETLAPLYLEDSQQDPLILLTVLQGAKVFSKVLRENLQAAGVRLQESSVEASSYGNGTKSSGKPVYKFQHDMEVYSGRNVLVVEDLIDEGYTLAGLEREVMAAKPKSLHGAVLLEKERERQPIEFPLTIGLSMPYVWMFGFGVDSGGKFRDLADIWAQTHNDEEASVVEDFLRSKLR